MDTKRKQILEIVSGLSDLPEGKRLEIAGMLRDEKIDLRKTVEYFKEVCGERLLELQAKEEETEKSERAHRRKILETLDKIEDSLGQKIDATRQKHYADLENIYNESAEELDTIEKEAGEDRP